MGPKYPRIETTIHWTIIHARKEINTIFQIFDEKIIKKTDITFPKTEDRTQNISMDQIMLLLKKIREKKSIAIKNYGLICVAENLEELEKNILKAFEEMK
jgi:hypothetical protein